MRSSHALLSLSTSPESTHHAICSPEMASSGVHTPTYLTQRFGGATRGAPQFLTNVAIPSMHQMCFAKVDGFAIWKAVLFLGWQRSSAWQSPNTIHCGRCLQSCRKYTSAGVGCLQSNQKGEALHQSIGTWNISTPVVAIIATGVEDRLPKTLPTKNMATALRTVPTAQMASKPFGLSS